MRHILVVDDEPNLVDGLCHVLNEALTDEIDISKAYGGVEALNILRQNPVDLVITDIRMPDAGGRELLQEIHKRRLNSRVLIITGYDEFNVIHEAVKLPFVDGFLLKNEGDEVIINAVKKSLTGIEEAERTQFALALAKRQNQNLDILLKERRMWSILGLLPYRDTSTALAETYLAIDTGKPFLTTVVRSFSSFISADAIIWLEQQFHRIFGADFSMEVSIIDSSDMVWLMQERDDATTKYPDIIERSRALRAGMLEIQSRLANNGVKISVAFSSQLLRASELPLGYIHVFKNVLQNLSISGRHQQVVDLNTDEKELFGALSENAAFYTLGAKYIHKAKNALLNGDEKEWADAMLGLSHYSAPIPAIMVQLLNTFIQTCDALGLPPITDVHKLLSPSGDYAGLNAAGISVCRKRKADSGNAISNSINRVHEVIEKNLDDPILSVSSIALETHYNPSYLSRLYKKQMGINITETINEARIRRACELLENPSIKIGEISHKVGYASPSSFTFFFRKQMGITPKEYRMERC